MTNAEKPTDGLPRFRPNELAAIKAAEYAAVVILDVAGRVMIGASSNPSRYASNVSAKTGASARVIHLGWAPDAALARRVRTKAGEILERRRIGGTDLYDVPGDLAAGAVGVAAERIGVRLLTTKAVLGRSDVVRSKHRIRTQPVHSR